MLPQQKGPYESRAKDAKIRNGVSGAKYTSQGVPISLIEQEAKRKEEFEHNMNDWINLNVSITGGRESELRKAISDYLFIFIYFYNFAIIFFILRFDKKEVLLHPR